MAIASPDAVRFVSERRLRKLQQTLKDEGERIAVNPDLPLWIDRARLSDGEIISLDAAAPDRLMLVCDESDPRTIYRGLLAERIQGSPLTLEFWASLTAAQQREIAFVLAAEHRVPETPTDDELAAALLVCVLDLGERDPEALRCLFPLTPLDDETIEYLRQSFDVESVIGAMPTALRGHVEPTTSNHAHGKPWAWHPENDPRSEKWIARGNFVRAAIAGSQRALDAFCDRLGTILHWSDATRKDWHNALTPLVAAASQATWPQEMRALYDLQRIVSDFSGSLDAVAPVEWIASFGAKPLRRPLEPVRDVILLKWLREVAKHVQRCTLPAEDRHRVEQLLAIEIHAAEGRVRAKFDPVLHRIFDGAGFKPANLPERIGRDCVVAELLDRLCENGFLRLAELRDAIARNSLKLPDCTLGDFLRGDALLQIDKRLSQELYGVYHRGEIYLRAIQRGSGVAFGTPVGRLLTLFLVLPFGGAFLAVEATKHLAHAVVGLFHLIKRLIEHAAIPEKVHHSKEISTESFLAMGFLGAVLLVLINMPAARHLALKLLSRIGQTLRDLCVALPHAFWMSAPVRWLVDNHVTRFVSIYILWPTFFAFCAMLLLMVFGSRLEIVLFAGAAAFLLAATLNLTPRGHALREDVAEYCHLLGRRVFSDFLPGLAGAVMWFFRELLGLLERGLYAIDEWFRYREGQSKPSLFLKASLALVWFPIAYAVRFAFYLLLEPQVNPIKHFPVVTVSHKVLLPLIGTFRDFLGVSEATAGLVVSMIPGIFGFLAWELRTNWKLYAANRPATLPPVPLGHHGETMRGLLRPGFHAGTVPKLYRKLRRTTDEVKRDRIERDLHHLHEAIERLIERDLLAYWQTVPALNDREPAIESILLGVQRVEAALAIRNGSKALRISFENINGDIVGSIDDAGWMNDTDAETKMIIAASLRGLFASAAVSNEAVDWNAWLALWEDSVLLAGRASDGASQ